MTPGNLSEMDGMQLNYQGLAEEWQVGLSTVLKIITPKGKLTQMYKFLSWTAVFLWMALIYYLSHQPAEQSSDLSSGVTEVIVMAIETVAPSVEIDIRTFHHIVRKNAHFLST